MLSLAETSPSKGGAYGLAGIARETEHQGQIDEEKITSSGIKPVHVLSQSY